MADLRFDRRMSDTEALVWALEADDPALRSTIAVVAVLERSPGVAELRAHLERVTRLLPRFRHRVVPGVAAFSPPTWEPDPHFDLGFHLRAVRLPCPDRPTPAAGRRRPPGRDGALPAALLRWAEPVVTEPLDRSRPLWQMTLVEGLPDARAALVVKLHHTFTDGLGAVKVASVLFELAPDAPLAELPPVPSPAAGSRLGPLAPLGADLAVELRRTLAVVRRVLPAAGAGLLAAARDPEPAAAATTELVRSLARLAAPSVRPLSPILSARSATSRLETFALPLEAVRAAAHAAGGTVNDAFVAALLAGLRRYHERHGLRLDAIRLGIPISTRTADSDASMRNQFAPVRLVANLQEPDAGERMRAVHAQVGAARREAGLGAVEQVAAVALRVPALRGLLAASMASIDVVASNVPGIDVPLYLRGARVEQLVPFGPRSAAALNATVVSYGTTLHLGLNLDAAAVPDPDVLVDAVRLGLAETLGA